MAETTDVREWARTHGFEVKDKGKLPAAVHQAHAAAMSSPDGDDTEPAGPDYDGGVSELDFVTADDPPDLDSGPGSGPGPGEADSAVAERKPRRAARAKDTARSFRERVWGGSAGKTARPKKKHPRVSLKGFAEDAFLDLAWAFQGAPPLEKIFYLQAPLAGQIVEDTARGTVADKVLQPVARVDRQFKAVEALTAPAWVFAIMTRGRKDANGRYSPDTQIMFGGLRHSLLAMSRVTDLDFEQLKQKSLDLKTASGKIDAIIAWLFEMPEPDGQDGAPAADGQAQAAAAAAGQNGR